MKFYTTTDKGAMTNIVNLENVTRICEHIDPKVFEATPEGGSLEVEGTEIYFVGQTEPFISVSSVKEFADEFKLDIDF